MSQPTILDYLNDDCWRCVLGYVHLKEVIISELVSRRWQAMVQRYMQTVRVALCKYEWCLQTVIPWPKVRWLSLRREDWSLFEYWTQKFGSTVVVAVCSSESQLEVIRENCPNVEYLTITGFEKYIPLNSKNKSFGRLQRLCFERCSSVTDRSLSQFINSSITELVIVSNSEAEIITGQFFKSVQSKLKLLILTEIELQLDHLLSAVDWLSELEMLALADLPEPIYENIHLVFDKTPKLELLHLFFHGRGLNVSKYMCRLTNMKHVRGSVVSTDEDLEAVTRSCKKLRFLLMGSNTVSVRGLKAMVRNAGAHLELLDLGTNYNLTDDDMVVCFRGCQNLTRLEVQGCRKLTALLRPLAEEARREMNPRPPPLRIRNCSTSWTIE